MSQVCNWFFLRCAAVRTSELSLRAAALALCFVPGWFGASAQVAVNAGSMWGTSSSGVSVNGALESTAMHNGNANLAASVNAARNRALIGTTTNLSITAVGSQTVISNTVIGNGNGGTEISATQSSANNGAVRTDGAINSSARTINLQPVAPDMGESDGESAGVLGPNTPVVSAAW